ncbi:MFS transporter [Rhodobacteraceae bacterium]|nr:MFS transporter [Paracoccaceae bacterium]
MADTSHLHIPGVNPNPKDPSPKDPPSPPPFVPKPKHHVAAYVVASCTVALAMSLSQGFVTFNAQRVAGDIGASQTESLWLTAAYMAPRASLSLLLVKIRTQVGLRNFAIASVALFALVNFATLWINSFHSAVAVEFLSGCAAAPLASVAVLYMLEVLPIQKKMTVGLPIVMAFILVGTPLAGAISAPLYDQFGWITIRILQFGLSLMAVAMISFIPLTPMPRVPVIAVTDVLTFTLLACGFAMISVLFTWGTTLWWTDTQWLGFLAAGAVVCLSLFAAIELQRERPLIDLRWLITPPILRLGAAMFLARLLLSEQTVGLRRLLQVLNYGPEQQQVLFAIIAVATLAGGIFCAMTFKLERMPEMHAIALALITTGLWMDTQVTPLYGPEQFYLSQAMIGFGSTMFLATAMANGVFSAFRRSPTYLLSFIAVFLASQSLGAVLGSGILLTTVQIRTTFHTQLINEELAASNPAVIEQIKTLQAMFANGATDAGTVKAQALSSLSQTVSTQSQILAYADGFHALSLLGVFTLTCLIIHYIWMKRQERLQSQTA